MDEIYDLLVLGGGPAGITAGIYAKRAGLNVAIIEKNMPGGAVNTTFEVENFTGFSKIGGMELATKMFEHLSNLNVPIIFDEVKCAKIEGDIKTVECFGGVYQAKSVILAFGASVRKLNLENEKKFVGRGVSYCATCDGNLFKGEKVALVGGGNTALEDALYLANICSDVYLIHRRNEFRGVDILSKQVESKGNIHLVLNSVVSEISGDDRLKTVVVKDLESGVAQNLDVSALFVCIGRGPDTEMIDGNLKLDENGYIKTDETCKTSVEGVYACGDIRTTPLRQIITACADGAIAATKAFEFVKTHK